MKTTPALSNYFDFYSHYLADYGEKTCVLMQIGSFYEMQAIKNENVTIGNLFTVAPMLNIQVTKKNKSIEKIDKNNPYMAGFPKAALGKFLPVLLENGFTVVLVDQDDKGGKHTGRNVVGIYSPSIQPLDIVDGRDSRDFTSVLIDVYNTHKNTNVVAYSVVNVNLNTNTVEVYENVLEGAKREQVLDDLYRVISRYDTKEAMFIAISSQQQFAYFEKEFVVAYMDLSDSLVHWKAVDRQSPACPNYKNFSDVQFQNAFLRKVYKHVNFGMLDPIDYFDLSMHQTSVLNILYVLDFIARHDEKYVQNFAPPTVTNDQDHLLLEMNTLRQLDILPNKYTSKLHDRYGSLLQVIDKTSSAIGRRGLKQLLCKPMVDPMMIQRRLEFSDTLDGYLRQQTHGMAFVEGLLDEVADLEKLHRKMSLRMLHPYEFYNLHVSYSKILQLHEFLVSSREPVIKEHALCQTTVDQLVAYVDSYTHVFKVDDMKRFSLNETPSLIENYFLTGCVVEIDSVSEKIREIENDVETIRKHYEDKIRPEGTMQEWIKTSYTDQDGYFFACTKIRAKLLQTKLNKEELAKLSIKSNTSACKITNDELKRLSLDLTNYRELFCKKIRCAYLDLIQGYSEANTTVFRQITQFIEVVDVVKSNIKCKHAYKFCKPDVVSGDESFVKAEQIRHPIIERINDKCAYVPNDVTLDTEKRGIVLYALNSCGKSSLLRSIGISVVLAQCGLYVPCDTFTICPFRTIVTQVDLYDNLWKAQSSFISEMIGLKKILKLADRNTLVLSDELTKGTEVVSATSLFAASVLELVKRKSKFVFTTHLQDVAKLKCVQTCEALRICHLSVVIEGNDILFERKLSDGPCSELYGLEVAKAVGLDSDFIDKSFEIRAVLLLKRKAVVNNKRSRYNQRKILDICEICGYTPVKDTDIPLDTHHIQFQCSADINNFTEHYHKNSVFNLVSLCKSCHQDVHMNKYTIMGYQETTNGTKLQYVREDDSHH